MSKPVSLSSNSTRCLGASSVGRHAADGVDSQEGWGAATLGYAKSAAASNDVSLFILLLPLRYFDDLSLKLAIGFDERLGDYFAVGIQLKQCDMFRCE